MVSFGLNFQIWISCHCSSLPCPTQECILAEFKGCPISQGIEGEKLGSHKSSYIKFVYDAVPLNSQGLGWGGDQWGAEEFLEGFAVDPE